MMFSARFHRFLVQDLVVALGIFALEGTVVGDPPMLIVLKSSAAVHSSFVEIGDISSLPNDPH
jgi:hypothetical protein